MKRRPFDEVCACEYETLTHQCLCTRRKEQAKAACPHCMLGNHRLEAKTQNRAAALRTDD